MAALVIGLAVALAGGGCAITRRHGQHSATAVSLSAGQTTASPGSTSAAPGSGVGPDGPYPAVANSATIRRLTAALGVRGPVGDTGGAFTGRGGTGQLQVFSDGRWTYVWSPGCPPRALHARPSLSCPLLPATGLDTVRPEAARRTAAAVFRAVGLGGAPTTLRTEGREVQVTVVPEIGGRPAPDWTTEVVVAPGERIVRASGRLIPVR